MDGILTNASAKATTESWLGDFTTALAAGDATRLAALFAHECHWRDILAFTWDLHTTSGAATIAGRIAPAVITLAPRGLKLAAGRTPPRPVKRAGTDAIEAIFTFETNVGPCNGVVRLVSEGGKPRAWTLMTALDEIRGHEDPANGRRWQDVDWKRNFGGENWADRRRQSIAYEDRDPTVLVVGAAQAGLMVAARLSMLGVDTLAIDREKRIGDSWRRRYHALTLHNETRVNHFPYMPFPRSWPVFIPKDMLANWFELYAEAMELNVWTATELTAATYDEAAKRWTVTLKRADGREQLMRPRHVVFCNGVSTIPKTPDLPGLGDYRGAVRHSGDAGSGTGWQIMYQNRGGGYYFDAGCSQMIVDGRVDLIPFTDIERFCAEGALMKDGTVRQADLIVLATGYEGQKEAVRPVLGDETTNRIGPVWGFDEEGELAGMWRPTGQPGLWFLAGGLAQCRIFSKVLALQIKARELGLVS